MIDFHTHILPGIDDGSSSTEESMEMLRLSYSQGITEIVATPHFYATQESPEHFLRRRASAARHLEEKIAQSRGQTGEGSGKTGADKDKAGAGEEKIGSDKDKTGRQIAERPSDLPAGHAPTRPPEKLVGQASAIQSAGALLPRIHLGAEVCFYTGIMRTEHLRQRCLG
ncbi:MAG: hypothetical protein LUF30_05135 [Lachnospiraceae bacterium]|nr:hypothetical protein [Lachnospiraceae bacterium]